jgi:hypothetical protein
MVRRGRIEIKLAELWQDIGTLCFDWYSELGMMIDEPDIDKIIKALKDLERRKKIFLTVKGRTIMIDYIGF